MNDYVTLDSKKYKALFGQWGRQKRKPAKIRMLLSGAVDVTYGPGEWYIWEGAFIVPATPDSGFGAPADLEASYAKTTTLAFTDHDGEEYTVHFVGVLDRKTLTPLLDGLYNRFIYQVRIIRVS